MAPPYTGRFAPSPTGPLHLGSLFAALASYLDAKAQQGQWLLRIEDVDELRTVTGSADEIKRCLEGHGLEWDKEAPLQSERKERYQEVLTQLDNAGVTFYCNCTRKQLREQWCEERTAYPGTCRHRRKADYIAATRQSPASHAIRFNTSKTRSVEFTDRIQGAVAFELDELGDFILRRRDSLFAYQLAVVADDIDQGISDVVRGYDLLSSTPWQMLILAELGHVPPRYAHLPLLNNAVDNAKLSKQTGAQAVDYRFASANIYQCLQLLGQPLGELNPAMPLKEMLGAAIKHWDMSRVPTRSISV